jgi:enoyl-CoA hydratase/carnithine racemase
MDVQEAAVTSTAQQGIGWLVFDNQARRNAMTQEMWAQAGKALQGFAQDDAIKVVVMRGAGNKAFISGADISQFDASRNNAEAARQYAAIPDQTRQAMSAFEKPVLAMIQGFCFGAGLDVAMRADIRLAADDAVFCIPAARLGIAYGVESIRLLVDLIGPAFAKDLLFSGRKMDAYEALSIGLVNRICAADQVEEVVRAYAAQIADNAPLSIRAAKFNVNEMLKDPHLRDLDRAAQEVWNCFDSEDYREGRQAFREKRRPEFRGR